MRNAAFILALIAVLATALPVATAGVGGGCVRTYARGYGEGTYIYSANNGAIGFGVETDAVGGGAAFFIVIQPSNCGNVEPPDPNDLGGSKGVDPIVFPHVVLP